MSRCIPFPPPGYVWNGVSGEALIELIKARKEKTKAKREKKKEKRSRNQKEKNEEIGEGEIRQKKQHHHESSKKCREKECEIQGMDRSSLTEELGQLISDRVYDSSDNSENIKRKRHNSPCVGFHHHGGIISISSQLQMHKDPEDLSSKPVCSTKSINFVAREKFEFDPSTRESNSVGHEFAAKSHTELFYSPSPISGMLQEESQFRDLILNWLPPSMQIQLAEFDDQEWLVQKRPPRSGMTEISDSSNDELCNGSSNLYPCSHYLPQADIYALPYTIPF